MRNIFPLFIRPALRVSMFILLTTLLIHAAPPQFSSSVHAQSGNRVHLPLVMKNFQSPPPFTYSYYVQDPATIHNLATALGQRNMQAGSPQDSIVVLAFGQAWTRDIPGGTEYGVDLINRGYVSFSTVNSAVQNFALAWLDATANSSHKLRLVVSINNFGLRFTTVHAQQFAGWIAVMRGGVASTPRVTLVAGIDAETEFNSAVVTRAYIDAFRDGLPPESCAPRSGEDKCLYDFGNAGGCSLTGGNSCNNGWTYDDVWYKATGLKRSTDTHRFSAALPQIYNTVGSNGLQWRNASLRGVTTQNQPVYFVGVMTQREACRQVSTQSGTNACVGTDNTPEQGFSNLRDSLNSNNLTSQVPIRWLTDISYQQYP